MQAVPYPVRREVLSLRERLDSEIPEWRSHEPIGHYQAIEDLIRRSTLRVKPEATLRERIDRVLTHRVLGPVIFVALMAGIFQAWSVGATRAMSRSPRGYRGWWASLYPLL